MSSRALLILSAFSLLLAGVVVALGAYVRLSDAGLGCPDWPGCYGRLFVSADLEANPPAAAPSRPFDAAKAKKEMAHRYAAGVLGLALFLLAGLAWRLRHPQRMAAYILAGLALFQSLLGMWTVTELLKPAIVAAHLLGGMAILAALYWLVFRQVFPGPVRPAPVPARWALAALVLLCAQIFLGGWTSANYAALVCPEFPACRDGQWWTVTELLKPAIVAAHLLGGMAILAALYWLVFRQVFPGPVRPAPAPARWALAALALLCAQIFLGGWTSANYAALICPEFPACRDGQWWPEADFREGFALWREGRIDYEGGVLAAPARTAIHQAHRLGAAVTILVVLAAAGAALRQARPPLRRVAIVLLCVLVAQASLGVANVLLRLPIAVAVAHNVGAALLLLALMTLYLQARGKPE